MILQIWNSSTNTYGRRERICQQHLAVMMELLNVSNTQTSPAHPQCNYQVEVFNKTVKKYLASFVDHTALNWETFLPALVLSYNTSYYSTIATIPFELLFGKKAWLPSFPNEDIQRVPNFSSRTIQFTTKNQKARQ
jgi:hypothetical protein